MASQQNLQEVTKQRKVELSAVTEKEDISLFYSHIFSDRNLQIDKSSIMFFTFLLEQLEQQVLYFLLSGV